MRRGATTTIIAVLLTHGASGWVTKTADGTREPMRWSIPTDQTSTEGLGAGIGWAIAPDFGEKMLDLFRENAIRLGGGRSFVSIETINDAIQRAMFQWSNNHKYINFFNATDRCIDEGKTCSAAELYIRAATTGGEQYGYTPVKVFQTLQKRTTARTTAGFNVNAGLIETSEVVFFLDARPSASDLATSNKPSQCFYLDETFCKPFQDAQREYDFKLMVEIICFVVWTSAIVMAAKRVVEWVIAYRKRGLEGARMILRAHTSHIAYSYYITLMLIFPPAFYWIAVDPCFTCYSFESLLVGAIGQVLGFDYVDTPGADNFQLTEQMSRDICASPQSHLAAAAADPSSVMRAPSTNVSNYCLTTADLDGLYRLYPLCSGAKLTPGCLRAKSNVGYLRVALAFCLPFGCVTVVIFTAVLVLRRIERKESDDVKKRLAVNAFATSSPRNARRRSSLGGRVNQMVGTLGRRLSVGVRP